MDVEYCFDTYALVKLASGDENIAQLLEKKYVVADLTLAEFYGVLLRKYNKQTAEYWLRKFRLYSLPVPLDILKEAVLLRQEHKTWSFFDAAGYALARHLDCKFVTGDQTFEGMVGVEYRK